MLEVHLRSGCHRIFPGLSPWPVGSCLPPMSSGGLFVDICPGVLMCLHCILSMQPVILDRGPHQRSPFNLTSLKSQSVNTVTLEVVGLGLQRMQIGLGWGQMLNLTIVTGLCLCEGLIQAGKICVAHWSDSSVQGWRAACQATVRMWRCRLW